MPHSEEPTNGHHENGSKPTRRGVYLLTHPRSASNLFQTMMAKQRSHGVDVQSSSYHFFDASFPTMMQMNRGSLEGSGWTEEDRAALYEPYKAAFVKLNSELADAEEKVSLVIFQCNYIDLHVQGEGEVRLCFAVFGGRHNYVQLWRAHASLRTSRTTR